MFQFEKTEPIPTTTAKLAVPQPVYDQAKAVASEHSVEVETVLIQALESAFGFKKRRRKPGRNPEA
jgi:hypothetical protein